MKYGGRLKRNSYDIWARMIVETIAAYLAEGVPIGRITVQNETQARQTWESCLYTAEQEADFLTNHLKPALVRAGLGDVKVFVWDHNKEGMLDRARSIMRDSKCAKAVDGIAFHWYSGDHFDALRATRDLVGPDRELIFTEGCDFYSAGDPYWELPHAEHYAREIIGDLEAGANGIIDWNILLDSSGGPNHVGNFCDAPIMYDLEAKKLGLRGIDKSSLPLWSSLLQKLYLLLPLVLLVWLVSTNTRSMAYSATLAILAAIIVSLFNKESRITPAKILEALEAGGKGVITVAVACCMAGIISGCITVTGLASELINTIVSISKSVTMIDPTIIALFLTMLCCIVLGMGVPTTANYCIMASTCAPILITIGVPKIAAHFFVFYFGIVADITPPVALAAYAGSAIAESNPMKTGINATKLAIAAFIVPYIFCLNTSMLLVDASALQVVEIIITSLLGIFGVAACMNGHLFKSIPWPLRIVLGIAGIATMYPTLITDVVGLAVMAVIFAIQYLTAKKVKAAA